MGLISGLIHAVALTSATPANYPGAWITDLDYPAEAKRRRDEGIVAFSLLIGPDGHILRCDITQSSNSPDLDQRTCVLLLARAKFKPATDDAGNSSYSQWNSRVRWIRPDSRSELSRENWSVRAADMVLDVQNLPGGASEKSIDIVTIIDPSGHVTLCEAVEKDSKAAPFAKAACNQVTALPPIPIKDNQGNAVSAVRGLKVTFKAAS